MSENQPVEIGQWRMSPLGVPVNVDGTYTLDEKHPTHYRVRSHLTLGIWNWSMVGKVELSSWPVIEAPAWAEE